MTMDTRRFQDATEQDYGASWDDLDDVSAEFADVRPRKDRQLNLRVDDDLLRSLRELSDRAGVGYHTFARRLIEEGVAAAIAEREAGLEAGRELMRPFRMKEVMLVLLGAPGPNKIENETIAGRTRLQKLLFLVAQHLKADVSARFEAYDFGPFDEGIEPDLEFLANEGLVEATGHEALPAGLENEPNRGERVLDWIWSRSAESAASDQLESYHLTQKGMTWVRRFLSSDQGGSPEAKNKLGQVAEDLKSRFGRVPLEELVDFVYSEYPEFTARSKIRHQVAERRARKAQR